MIFIIGGKLWKGRKKYETEADGHMSGPEEPRVEKTLREGLCFRCTINSRLGSVCRVPTLHQALKHAPILLPRGPRLCSVYQSATAEILLRNTHSRHSRTYHRGVYFPARGSARFRPLPRVSQPSGTCLPRPIPLMVPREGSAGRGLLSSRLRTLAVPHVCT